ncbi:uncharacterized protein LOC130903854 [Diorhabda carinulata]|uniref:uncharacterized protein LOC130903854 n=1 Tax=Diorhabda carinulata TaxID=1163345 RepID=UPI0025A08EC9|nr:uncharacterized protein LOC130903854 [Diorhabda carinulata]
MWLKIVFIPLLLVMECGVSSSVTIYNPYFHFTGGSDPFMGTIVTIAIPVEAGTPGDVILSVILEGNYVLPTNETSFEYPPEYPASSEERTFIYDIIKRKLEKSTRLSRFKALSLADVEEE